MTRPIRRVPPVVAVARATGPEGRMRSVRLLPVLLAAGLAALPACSSRRACVPDELAASRNLIDLSLPPDAHAPVPPGALREVSDEFRRRAGPRPPGRPYHFLALSGGGLYG